MKDKSISWSTKRFVREQKKINKENLEFRKEIDTKFDKIICLLESVVEGLEIVNNKNTSINQQMIENKNKLMVLMESLQVEKQKEDSQYYNSLSELIKVLLVNSLIDEL